MGALPLATNRMATIIPEEVWEDAGRLPCVLTIEVLLQRFTVRDLLRLEPGSIVSSGNVNGAHVPVNVNKRVLGWGEFEVVGDRLAIRMTELE